MTIPCRVLMIYPKFVPNSFWNYTEACELVGAKYPAAPLGLITVAAMLPKHWEIRLVNRNTEFLTDENLDWADLVATSRREERAAELRERHGVEATTSNAEAIKGADVVVLAVKPQDIEALLGEIGHLLQP